MKSKLITSLDKSDKKKIFNDWNTLLKSLNSPFALYASPTWFETLHNIDPSNYILGISETEEDQVQSIIPIEIKSKELIFSIYRKDIFKYKFNCAYVLGGEPLGIISSQEYDELFKKLINSKTNLSAISFKCIRESSPFSIKLTDIIKNTKDYIHFIERETDKFTYIKFCESFDEYLGKFRQKARYNLKRQYRIGLEKTNNNLKLDRITDPSQIDFFIKSGKYVLNNSWKSKTNEKDNFFSEKNRRIFKTLASKGLFRSYVLISNDEPWAFVLGFQHQDIFHYSNIAYNNKFSDLSPGSVLFYKMLEDLFSHDKPDILNFGIGDAQYKTRFGTNNFMSSDHVLFKKNLKNMFFVKVFVILNNFKSYTKIIMEMKQSEKVSVFIKKRIQSLTH